MKNVAMLFLLQGVYQILTANKQHKLIKFYVLPQHNFICFNEHIMLHFMAMGALKILIITSDGFSYAFFAVSVLFVFLCDTLIMVAEATEKCR